jgi:hypothetical protein
MNPRHQLTTRENDMTVATIILNTVFAAFVVAAIVGGLWRSIVLHRRDELRTEVAEVGQPHAAAPERRARARQEPARTAYAA